ncbi:hypothetical protein F5X98DRAFT_216447 [Xylaria grammica]|nr:hypothetical protein F5X98DRAFT_216447 [Xylaria grammica]
MVRIKERYLLVNILYPGELGTRADLPDVVVLNQPTSDELTHSTLLRAIRAEVASLFGDYGMGALEGGGLAGKPSSRIPMTRPILTNACSQVPLASNLNLHTANRTSLLPICLGSLEFHEFGPC